VPVNTPILESYAVPGGQVFKVTDCPVPTNVYHTPGAVLSVVMQVGTASIVAPTVVPTVDEPQVIGIAAVHKSLGGAETVQLVHCTVVVRQEN
jgi:hypothetical protein